MGDLYRINPKADSRDVFHAVSPDPGGEPALVLVEPDIEAASRQLWSVLRLAMHGYLDAEDDAVLHNQVRSILAAAYPKEDTDG